MKADARSTLDMFPHPERALRGADWGVLFDQKAIIFLALLSHHIAPQRGMILQPPGQAALKFAVPQCAVAGRRSALSHRL
jgi:hypothetical protein